MPISSGHCGGERGLRGPVASISETSLPMNSGITVSISATARLGDEHGRVPALRLPHEMPVEREQALGRRAGAGIRRGQNLGRKKLHERCSRAFRRGGLTFGSASERLAWRKIAETRAEARSLP